MLGTRIKDWLNVGINIATITTYDKATYKSILQEANRFKLFKYWAIGDRQLKWNNREERFGR